MSTSATHSLAKSTMRIIAATNRNLRLKSEAGRPLSARFRLFSAACAPRPISTALSSASPPPAPRAAIFQCRPPPPAPCSPSRRHPPRLCRVFRGRHRLVRQRSHIGPDRDHVTVHTIPHPVRRRADLLGHAVEQGPHLFDRERCIRRRRRPHRPSVPAGARHLRVLRSDPFRRLCAPGIDQGRALQNPKALSVLYHTNVY